MSGGGKGSLNFFFCTLLYPCTKAKPPMQVVFAWVVGWWLHS